MATALRVWLMWWRSSATAIGREGSLKLLFQKGPAQFRTTPEDTYRQNHHRDNNAACEHAWPVDRATEKRRPTEQTLEPWEGIIAQPRNHHENAPEPEDDTGNRRQHFDQRRKGLPNPERSKLSQIRCRCDAQWNRNQQRDERRNQRSVNEGQRAELLRDWIPG